MKTTQRGFIVPLVILIIAALGIGGGIYYAEKAKKTPLVESETTTATENTVAIDTTEAATSTVVATSTSDNAPLTGPTTLNLTFEELLAYNAGKTAMCTGSFVANGGVVKTVTYINGNLIRGDSTGVYKGVTAVNSAIVKGTDIYSWSGSAGMKIKLNASFDLHAALSLAASGAGVWADQKGEYVCTSWTVDATKFIPPTSVQFTDYGSFDIPAVSKEMLDEMMKR